MYVVLILLYMYYTRCQFTFIGCSNEGKAGTKREKEKQTDKAVNYLALYCMYSSKNHLPLYYIAYPKSMLRTKISALSI